jgi:hypothetical protein
MPEFVTKNLHFDLNKLDEDESILDGIAMNTLFKEDQMKHFITGVLKMYSKPWIANQINYITSTMAMPKASQEIENDMNVRFGKRDRRGIGYSNAEKNKSPFQF